MHLFESGAIILHLAQTHSGLLPADPNARARAQMWLIAALNTVEPPIVQLEDAEVMERDKPWYAQRLPLVEERIRARLTDLAARLGDDDWLDGDFSAGDLMMVLVLRRLEGEDGKRIFADFPTVTAYVARGEARPAYQRAFAAQKAVFDQRSTNEARPG